MKKPSIIIYNNSNEIAIKEILYGIEEEGIPYIVENKEFENINKASHDAALSSPLSVGIALDSKNIAVHYATLKEDKPMFYNSFTGLMKKNIRTFGVNAARLVKGMPFILEE